MSATPSPPGWVIPNPSSGAFSFTGTFSGVNSLSDQALRMDTTASPKPVILPDNSPGNVSETRVEFAAMSDSRNRSAGIVFGFQDIDNYLAVETLLEGYEDDKQVQKVVIHEKVSGSISLLTQNGSSTLSVDPTQEWVDVRIQVFRPSSSEVRFRVSAADHGNKYQSLATTTLNDSQLPFTSGDVGLTCGHQIDVGNVAFDGDAVASGGRPIKMYWA